MIRTYLFRWYLWGFLGFLSSSMYAFCYSYLWLILTPRIWIPCFFRSFGGPLYIHLAFSVCLGFWFGSLIGAHIGSDLLTNSSREEFNFLCEESLNRSEPLINCNIEWSRFWLFAWTGDDPLPRDLIREFRKLILPSSQFKCPLWIFFYILLFLPN